MRRPRSLRALLVGVTLLGAGAALYASPALSAYGRITAESSDRAEIVRRLEPTPTWIVVVRGAGIVFMALGLLTAGAALFRE